MSTREQIEKACMEPLPRAAVSSRSQAGTTLSYVDQHYVIHRLCEVFGPLGYDTEIVELVPACEPYESTSSSGKTTWRVGYRCRVRLTVRWEGGSCSKEDVGVGQGIDRDLVLAHESGAKEAATDGLKRAARLLGASLGLALYDKTQEHVESTADRILRLVDEGNEEGAKALARDSWRSLSKGEQDAVTKAIKAAQQSREDAAMEAVEDAANAAE